MGGSTKFGQIESIMKIKMHNLLPKSTGYSLKLDLYFKIFPGPSAGTCEILARYHAPGAGWYWDPHTAAINIPIYFLTYIFSHYFKNIPKYSLKTVGSKGIRTTDLLIMSQGT